MSGTCCPRCHEPVRLPPVSSTARVRCPWCRAEYEYAEAAQGLPPLLEVVSDELSAGLIEEGDEASVPVAGGFSPFAIETDQPSPSQFDEMSSLSPESSSRREPMRPRRQSGSPIVGFLKIAGGGVAGILIAMVILQYMGRLPDMGFYPFRGPGKGLFGDSNAGSDARRAAPPPRRPQRAMQLDAGPDETSFSGRELEIPSLDEFGGSEAPSDSQASEEIEARIEQFRTAVDHFQTLASDVSGATREQAVEAVVDSASALAEQFQQAAGLADSQRTQLDAIVIGVSRDRDLLRALVPATRARLAAAQPDEGVLVLGRVKAQDDTIVMENHQLDFTDSVEPFQADEIGFALGTLTNQDPARINVQYARKFEN